MTPEASMETSPSMGDGRYARVQGLNLYYECRGAGPALVLLHGGLCSLPVWPQPVRFFSGKYREIAPEQMGHGRTADDPSRPMDYHAMAEATAELLQQLGVDRTFVLGWSDGGVVGLDLAMHHPSLVTKLAVSGANIRPSAAPKSDGTERTADDIPAFIRQPYERLSPNGPSHWPVVYGRLNRMWQTQPNFTRDQLGRITASTLVAAGDRDVVSVEETLELWRAIPRAELWIAPHSDHGLPLNQSALFNATIGAFFDSSSR